MNNPTPWRPRFHAAPAAAWMNDPNALWRGRDGRWRLLYQHRDDPPHWRRTHWGTLLSFDLLHWQAAPPALAADEHNDRFSGCVVREGANLVAYSTAHRREGARHEHIERHDLSDDDAPFPAGTPVIDEGAADFRDPFVWRHGGRWWLLLARPCPWDAAAPYAGEPSRLCCYVSDDGRRWAAAPWHDPTPALPRRMWEVPQMLPLARLGATDDTRWLLLFSELDRNREPMRSAVRWRLVEPRADGWSVAPGPGTLLDHGPDFYATLPHTPSADGEAPLLLAWMSNWSYARRLPLDGFAGGPMTLPRRLTWDGDAPKHDAITTAAATMAFELAPQVGDAPHCIAADASAVDLMLRWTADMAGVIELGFAGFDAAHPRLRLDPRAMTLQLDRPPVADAGLDASCGWAGHWAAALGTPAPLRIVLDGCCLEVFADSGRLSLSALLPPSGRAGLWLRRVV